MDMHTKIKKELIRRFDENNWSKLTLHMKVSGDDVIIDPCHIFATEHTKETVQYFFIESPSIPQAGEETLNDLVDFLAHYDENCKKQHMPNRLYRPIILTIFKENLLKCSKTVAFTLKKS